MHKGYDGEEAKQTSGTWKYGDARKAAVDSVMDATKDKAPPCKPKCIKDQIDDKHAAMGINDKTDLRANKYGPAPKSLKIVPPGKVSDGGDV